VLGTYSEVFLCYIDIWFLTYGIRAQGLGVSQKFHETHAIVLRFLLLVMRHMPPKKGTSTPNKPPDNPTWTLDEGEEMHRDINDLQNKTVTKDELQEMMDSIRS
jgi:hypothetical protein